MRLLVTDSPQPFLFRRMILVQGKEEICLDFREVLCHAGLLRSPREIDANRWTIPSILSLICDQPSEFRSRIEQTFASGHQQKGNSLTAYDQRTLVLRKPIESCSKVIIVGHRAPISRNPRETEGMMVSGFLKFASSLADPGAKIRLPRSDGIFDVDAVLGVVIGKRAERISKDKSLSCIAGFTLLVDVTDRKTFEIECGTNNNLMAKNRPNLSAIGPCIRIATNVDLDRIIEVTLRLNGEVRQQFTLGDLVYGVKEMVSAWSRLTLEPGDVLGLGATIARPRPGNTLESPVPIKPGNLIEVESPTIGRLKVEVV
jgi:2-keto-4-pentenoate hydratase/2-oxohepta-3-ene-1,7-dioic acid hydratase in catechol pathway